MTMPDDADRLIDQWSRFLAALEADCPVCAGTGVVLSDAWQAWHERAGELSRVALAARRASGMRLDGNGAMVRVPDELPRRREPAEGHPGADAPTVMAAVERAIDEHERARPAEAEHVPCRACAGCGLVLTPIGRRLAQLLHRHGFVTVPDATPPPAAPGTNGGRA
ncbi:hypothetical protein SAMN04489712_11848 [Thermomonospora echinospora]|uniref:Uncharacterized protein n=1 Tax=Thermomonospora echinospora TaxID=1992 RepID=A0A1H6DLN9_9ACTN|nr:hypothetical protein [Thermomonospora echinospora]SEG85626.1 hypothetical protein SAMN04489712_11848 [Thermomonospora echinospora]